MANSEAVKVARIRAKAERDARAWEREKILYERVLTPNVARVALMAGIIAYATYCARSPRTLGPVQSGVAFALTGIGIPLIAADAGIKDKFALAAISAAGVGYTTGQMVQGWNADQLWQALTPWPD